MQPDHTYNKEINSSEVQRSCWLQHNRMEQWDLDERTLTQSGISFTGRAICCLCLDYKQNKQVQTECAATTEQLIYKPYL